MKKVIIEIHFPKNRSIKIDEGIEEVREILTNLKYSLNHYKIEDGNENINFSGIKTIIKLE